MQRGVRHYRDIGLTPSSAVVRAATYSDEPGHILVVEDHPALGQAMCQQLELFGHTCDLAASGHATEILLASRLPDLVILDVHLPDTNGYAICASIKHNPATWQIPVIMVTVEAEYESRLLGIEAEADQYMRKPVDARELEAYVRMLLRAKRRTDRMEQAEDVIFSLARAVEAKDSYTEGHTQRLARYAEVVGTRLGMNERELEALRHGAMLHDVGKVGVDEAIIRKRGSLTPAERILIQEHTIIGERIVQPLRMAALVGPIVRNHHERWDGHGYPDQLRGEQIPLGARIVAVVDAFDAMTTQRPYNTVLSCEEAIDRLEAGAETYWDSRIVGVFIDWLVEGSDEGGIERAVGA